MEIKSEKIENIKEHPQNPNTHSKKQIDRLVKLIKENGFRQPLIVSNQSGYLVSGHARLEACKKLGLKEVPVIYQDFKSKDQEKAHLVADNAISEWSKIDMLMLDDLDFKDDFDFENLGFVHFKPFNEHDFSEGHEDDFKNLDEQGTKEESQKPKTKCPKCGHEFR